MINCISRRCRFEKQRLIIPRKRGIAFCNCQAIYFKGKRRKIGTIQIDIQLQFGRIDRRALRNIGEIKIQDTAVKQTPEE